MTVTTYPVNRVARPSSLADVLDVILDKGIVIDAYVRVSVIGIELLTIEARIVIASVDTYLQFAEAVNRLQAEQPGREISPWVSEPPTRDIFKSPTIKGAENALGSLPGAGEILGGLSQDDSDGHRRDDRDASDRDPPARRAVPAGREAPTGARRGGRADSSGGES